MSLKIDIIVIKINKVKTAKPQRVPVAANFPLLRALSFPLWGQRSGGGDRTGVSSVNGEPGDSLPE